MAQTKEKEKDIDKDSFENFLAPEAHECNAEDSGRFKHFRNILLKCAEKCFAPAGLEKISSCLQEIRIKNPGAFDSIIQQLVDNLQANVTQELELMIKQESLVSLCHELDQIIEKSREEKGPSWRPSGRPTEDIKDHVMHAKLEFREKLQEKLKLLEDENQRMQKNVTFMRNNVTDTEGRITAKQKELEKIADACDGVNDNNNLSDCGKGSLEKMATGLQ